MIYFFLKFGNESFYLPVTPSSFELSGSNGNTVVNINDLGDINLLGKRGLYEISISSFFPNQKYNFCLSTMDKPYNYIKKIKKWYEQNLVGQLIISGTNINLTCSIENFTYGERDGSGDVYYEISLKEYRKLSHSVVRVSTNVSTNNDNRTVKATSAHTYTVKKGDTLSGIAKKETGSSSNWQAIYNDNKSVVGSNPNLIYPGQVLTIRASY